MKILQMENALSTTLHDNAVQNPKDNQQAKLFHSIRRTDGMLKTNLP